MDETVFKIRLLNSISHSGLAVFPTNRYRISENETSPDGILLRSFDMHAMDIPHSLKVVGRAGAGVNNIPIEQLSKRGIAVFNTPGANANAVKELVLAGMLLACRNICQAWQYVGALEEEGAELETKVETAKKHFAGFELYGRTLGVIGLGAIGVQVANMARLLGMHVLGFDPGITIQSAWRLSADIQAAHSIEDILGRSDFVSVHVPLMDSTYHLLDMKRLQKVKKSASILNFARAGIIDDIAIRAALDEGRLHAYVCDFPSSILKDHERIIALPHLGASTQEAEENCARMIAGQLIDYFENGNIRNAVNLPDVNLPRTGKQRLSIINENCPGMLGYISQILGDDSVNIIHMINESKGEYAYTLIDVETCIAEQTLTKIKSAKGILTARII